MFCGKHNFLYYYDASYCFAAVFSSTSIYVTSICLYYVLCGFCDISGACIGMKFDMHDLWGYFDLLTSTLTLGAT